MNFIKCSLLLLVANCNLCFSMKNGHGYASIKHQIFKDYNKEESPNNATTNLDVLMHVALGQVDSTFLDYEGSLSIGGRFFMNWYDSRFEWDPADHDNIYKITVPRNKVWTPKPVLVTTLKSTQVETHNINFARTDMVYCFSSGYAIGSQHFKILRLPYVCDNNIRNWPHDVKQCTVRIAFPSDRGQNISLRIYSETASRLKSNLVKRKDSPWKLDDLTVTKVQNNKTKEDELVIGLVLKRNGSVLEAYFFTPSLVQLGIMLVLFWMDPRNHERIVLTGLLILLHILTLQSISDHIPSLGKTTPIFLYISAFSFFLTVIHFVTTVISRKMLLSSHNPTWLISVTSCSIRNPIISYVYFLNVDPKVAAELIEENDEGLLLESKSNKLQKRWQIMSQLLNYSMFLIFSPVCFSLAVIFFNFSYL